MKVRRLFSVGLSIVVIFTQLTLPLSRAQASPAALTGPTQPASQQPRPWLPLDDGQTVIPVMDDATDSQVIDPPSSSVPPVTIASPATPVAPQGTLEVPLGVGNNNYGQTQRDTDNPQNHPGHHFAGSVNLVNGNLFLTVGDFFIPGRGLSLQLARSYNSLAAANGEVGAFGAGWTHSYETQVISETGGITLTVREADGALHDYHSPAPCPGTPAYTCYESPPGLYRQLYDMAGAGYGLLYKNGTVQLFGAEGQLVEITDRSNNQINLYYYPSPWCNPGFAGPPGTLCRVDDTSTIRSLLFQNNMATGLVESVQEWLAGIPGRQITYVYTGQDLSSVGYPEGGEVFYGYDGQHRMTSYVDPRQPEGVRKAEEILYDVQHRVERITYDSFFDVFIEIAYDQPPEQGIDPGAVTAAVITDGAGGQSRVEFDAHANVVYEGDWFPDLGLWIGKWWWWHPERWWLLWRKVDANLHETTYTYDDWGNTTDVTNALGATQRFLWEPPYYETFGTGITSYGNVLSATNSLNVTTLYYYDYAMNSLIEIQAAGTSEESATVYESDDWGQLVRQIDPAGQITSYAYDEFGNTTVITDARGSVTGNFFDEVGRPIRTVDQAGNETLYKYDAADRLESVADPEGGVTRYTYSPDGRDNLVQLVNANGVTTTYTYDALDRLITQINSLNQTTGYAYDAASRLVERSDADGRVTRYQYDAKSHMTKAEYYEAGATDPYQVNQYRYDPAGNLVWMANDQVRLAYAYDAIDQRTRIDMWTPTWGMTRTLQLERDPQAGNLTQIIGPGEYTVGYEYDSLNRLTTVTDPDGRLTTYEYDLGGRVHQVTYPEGVAAANYAYNETNHLTQLTYDLTGTESVSYTYAYDGQGNLTREVNEGEVYSYTYDAVGRVTSATSDLHGEVSFEYDKVGNRLRAHGDISDTRYIYDDHNRLLNAGDATFEYNEMGARTQTQVVPTTQGGMGAQPLGALDAGVGTHAEANTILYSYDNDMRLTQVNPGLTFLYDPLGNLIGTVDSAGNRRYFLRDGEDIYLELDGNGGVVAQYTVGADSVLSMWRDGHRYLFLSDGRGLIRRVLDLATGQVVTQYGPDLSDPGSGLYLYNPVRIRGAWWFPEVSLILFGEGVFWDPWFGTYLVKAWPWLYWPFGPFHPWRPIFRFWPWPWPWPRPWGWPWPRPWPFLWPWPGAWVRPWVIWPFWPWVLRPWWPWWYWRSWWGWTWWGRWWCWHPWWWFGKWWWWPWWHPWWWWGYWWFPWWWWWSCWWWPAYWWWWHWWWWPWWWGGWFWWCWWWWWPWPWWWWWPWMWPPVLGPPEVGDAPDPPYPSYRRNRGAVHGVWWYEWLGAGRDGEWDSDQVDADRYDDGVAVNLNLPTSTLVFTPTVAYPNSTRYGPWGPLNVHAWFDWNSDGDWDDLGELVVVWSGYPGDQAAGGDWPAGQDHLRVTQPFIIPNTVFGYGNVADLWLRVRLNYADNTAPGPRGYTRFGEVEDHRLTVIRPHRPPWADRLTVSPYAPLVLTYTQVVSGVSVSITPAVQITPTWSGGPSPLAVHRTLDGTYGDQVSIEHEPFTVGQRYTVTLSSGRTYTGTEAVLPSAFSFTADWMAYLFLPVVLKNGP